MAESSTEIPMQDSSPVYVPLESLTEPTVRSIVSVAISRESPTWDYSERTLLRFLLAINDKLTEIENHTHENDQKFDENNQKLDENNQKLDENNQKLDENIIQHAKQVRQWLVNKKNEPLIWDDLQKEYDHIAKKKCRDLARYHGSKDADPYFELRTKTPYDDVKQSRKYMNRFREHGYKPEELKLYWNAEQLENLCPKQGESSGIKPPHDPSDADAVENLLRHPVSERNNSGTITYVTKGIEKAVFDVPKESQIIVLNFANEQSPGGGYLRHARAQEEVILFNSDGYRALLDLKYRRMGGGYAIPEFGLAYVRNMRFFDSKNKDEPRITDMMVSACYCMNGQELYRNPKDPEQWKRNNLAKFRAFMSAAVANTVGDGRDTYLLLGPIGTGAFGNDVEEIGKVFRDVLEMKMMNSSKPIRYAFEHIWFVSTEGWKNDIFQQILSEKEPNTDQEN